MIDISIFMPAIRTHLWDEMYDSIKQSCKKYSWELVLCGPFELTDYLKKQSNVKYIKDFGSPSRCAQLCLFEIDGDLAYHVVDDARFLENSIDESIDLYKEKCSYKDVVNCRYREGENFSGETLRDSYWWAWGHDSLRLQTISQNYKISLHHILKTEYLIEMGGYNCEFNHQNHNCHDLMFRIQADGGKLFDSINDVTSCSHFIDRTVDHAPIFDSHTQIDEPLFMKMYSNPNVLKDNLKIDINNWANSPPIWTRRFKGTEKSYSELIK